jgi:hypothetical protein
MALATPKGVGSGAAHTAIGRVACAVKVAVWPKDAEIDNGSQQVVPRSGRCSRVLILTVVYHENARCSSFRLRHAHSGSLATAAE